mgnify:CR=1 FL=1
MEVSIQLSCASCPELGWVSGPASQGETARDSGLQQDGGQQGWTGEVESKRSRRWCWKRIQVERVRITWGLRDRCPGSGCHSELEGVHGLFIRS